MDVITVEPSDKGHNRNNLPNKGNGSMYKTKETFLYNIFLTFFIGENGQKTMGPKRVHYSEVPLYCTVGGLVSGGEKLVAKW